MHRTTLAGVVCATTLTLSACSTDSPTATNADPNIATPAQFAAALGRFKVKDRVQLHELLAAALDSAQHMENGGFGLNMWGSIVSPEGFVLAVAFTGKDEDDQWQGSRVISAQKGNTAAAFSLETLALSTANLYSATQPGGTLFGLQESNPVNTDAAYGGKPSEYGTVFDNMVGKRIGGINVFGGGLALYDAGHTFDGGVGVSGDASCADHNIAWKVRSILHLDFVPAGVDPVITVPGRTDDNIVYDIDSTGKSASGWGHPVCNASTEAIGLALPTDFPIH
jgi:uncharacterized protein GlcG (DUF336 family)